MAFLRAIRKRHQSDPSGGETPPVLSVRRTVGHREQSLGIARTKLTVCVCVLGKCCFQACAIESLASGSPMIKVTHGGIERQNCQGAAAIFVCPGLCDVCDVVYKVDELYGFATL